MITVGIDCGNQNTKAILMEDGKIVDKASVETEFDGKIAAEKVYTKVLKNAGVRKEDVHAIVTTGAGRDMVDFSNTSINEVSSAAKGSRFINADVNLVIDLGAEGCRAMQLNRDGKVKNYEVNDKCASGAGTFIEAMARALQIKTEEMGDYSLRHKKDLPMNAQCVVFSESEVISLIHQQETVEDIAHGIHVGICNRISSLIRRVGIVDGIMLIGGPGYNKGLVKCLQDLLEKEIVIAEDSEFISAIGAAVYAVDHGLALGSK
ncbi:acyl-CoA dehydratase activase [Acetobacterium wieringae]|uniref:acyl-CoA dehydratase activase n=1 Tax=Acetobacterium wieringae TaxID=52694 RepID=UPI0026EB9CA0|nr:acyl-CoA dehydratase activase [Acetobacterium wieringae]